MLSKSLFRLIHVQIYPSVSHTHTHCVYEEKMGSYKVLSQRSSCISRMKQNKKQCLSLCACGEGGERGRESACVRSLGWWDLWADKEESLLLSASIRPTLQINIDPYDHRALSNRLLPAWFNDNISAYVQMDAFGCGWMDHGQNKSKKEAKTIYRAKRRRESHTENLRKTDTKSEREREM